MADIDLQRKRHRSWWPWILAALVAILAVWAVTEVFDSEPDVAGVDDPALVAPAPDPATGPAAEMGPAGEGAASAVADFRQQCVNTDSGQDMARQHQWTVDCLQSLAAAMDATIQADTVGTIVLQERLSTLRERASEVRQADPSATSHAGTVAAALDAGAELIRTYQEQRPTGQAGYADSVQEAADQLTGDQPLLEQREAVHSYFEAMGQALQTIGS